jgi:hypothetical protein
MQDKRIPKTFVLFLHPLQGLALQAASLKNLGKWSYLCWVNPQGLRLKVHPQWTIATDAQRT